MAKKVAKKDKGIASILKPEAKKVEKVERKKAHRATLACRCVSKFQDARYGKGKRVHNLTGGSGKTARPTKGYRCTVCGDVKL